MMDDPSEPVKFVVTITASNQDITCVDGEGAPLRWDQAANLIGEDLLCELLTVAVRGKIRDRHHDRTTVPVLRNVPLYRVREEDPVSPDGPEIAFLKWQAQGLMALRDRKTPA